MLCKVAILSKCLSTLVIFIWAFALMYSSYMLRKAVILSKCLLALVAFIWAFALMHSSYMPRKVAILSKGLLRQVELSARKSAAAKASRSADTGNLAPNNIFVATVTSEESPVWGKRLPQLNPAVVKIV